MANNDLSNTENILVKVDQNNLMFIDPNSVVVGNEIQPRSIDQEKLAIFVNLEADIIPRSILTSSQNDVNTLTSIAKGTLNFLSSQNGEDKNFTTDWSNSYNPKATQNVNGNVTLTADQFDDSTGQSFGIDSINVVVKGANFVPQVNINFIDVRGKTLFESAENSPYKAFFHIPWPIFYLTIKGFYGKAIRYRLHLVKFNTRYNESNGNFEVQTSFVGSTYAFLNDIPLKGIINAPYMYAKLSEENATFNEITGLYEKKVLKSSKGYSILNAVYSEMKQKKLIPNDFPVKTLREIGVIAKSLDKTLEKMIFDQVIEPKVLNALKEYKENIDSFQVAVRSWGTTNLTTSDYLISNEVTYFGLKSKDKSDPKMITGSTTNGTLEKILNLYDTKLKSTVGLFNEIKKDKSAKINTSLLTNNIQNITSYYNIFNGQYKVAIEKLINDIQTLKSNFMQQDDKIMKEIETKMNTVIKDKTKGFGFEPTVRNLFAVLLANAEVYVRLMKNVHSDAFNISETRKDYIGKFDEESVGESIYPWPEIKKTVPGSKQKVVAYPGEPELQSKLRSNDTSLWPEVGFVEEFISVATNKTDPLTESEGGVNDLNYIFENNSDESKINSVNELFDLQSTIPYSERNVVSFLYEIYERAKLITLVDSFDINTIRELVEKEFKTIEDVVNEEDEIVDILSNNIRTINNLTDVMIGMSPYNRYPYYKDSIPTTQYLRNILESPFDVQQYNLELEKKQVDVNSYNSLSVNLVKYTPEDYRLNIYPFNSDLYLSYINKTKYTKDELTFNGILDVNQKQGFITSPFTKKNWIKSNYRTFTTDTNLFTQKLKITSEYETNILNTSYFHKQLYSDFTNNISFGKYVGSAYLLVNSLPYLDLDDNITFENGKSVRMSSLFREIGSTHFIPYHLMVKWGSIYHRYKRKIIDGEDILTGFTTSNTNTTTTSIDGNLFFNDNETGSVFTGFTVNTNNVTYSGGVDVGIHPYYDAIYHQVVNGYNHYNVTSGNTSFSENVTDDYINYRLRDLNKLKYWTGYVDNSKFDSNTNKYTVLPCDGDNKFIDRKVTIPLNVSLPTTIDLNSDTFANGQQRYYRVIWEDEYINSDFSGKTFFGYDEYNKITGNTYSLEGNNKKVIDLIATFSPQILETFEEMFLDFATETLEVELPYKKFTNVKYDKFQTLLSEILTVEKKSTDSTDKSEVINLIKGRQKTKLLNLSEELCGENNFIKLSLGNPKEIDPFVFKGYYGETGNTLTYDQYDTSQSGNTIYIKLYIGDEPDSNEYYKEFFTTSNMELSEENVLLFRPLIMIYGGYRKNGGAASKTDFQEYIKNNIFDKFPINGVGGADYRLSLFLTLLTQKFSNLKVNRNTSPINFVDGYNNRELKVELYNFFKSFNDKWSSGNSIGQRLLMEEFLFLDKANRDIGNRAYLNIDRFISLLDSRNDKVNLYSAISMLIQGTGFDMRALPAYVNFYGPNLTTKTKIVPSKKVASNIFGTFLEVDYEESSPKIVIQFVGPQSKHLADLKNNGSYKFADDSFHIGDINNNPLVVTLPQVFTTEELSKSNKVVAFEVSIGDQNQGIFKSVQLDQSTIKNTSESFVVLENLARSESGSGTYNVDIGLFEYYRQASYQCEVTCMGNVMIQPTMFFYLKNVPMFRGSYWITEVSHSIRNNSITTTFKGSRIPRASLPDPEDSFVSSYRPLLDKIINNARLQVKNATGDVTTEVVVKTDYGNFTTDNGGVVIKGESEMVSTPKVGVSEFGVPFNGWGNEKFIQKIKYTDKNGITGEWYRSKVARMGSGVYPINGDTHMGLVSKLKSPISVYDSEGNTGLKWSELADLTTTQKFYSTKFKIVGSITANHIITATTEFLNPNSNDKKFTLEPSYQLDRRSQSLLVQGPINVGPNIDGYGIAMSESLMKELNIHEGEIVYFRLKS